jgi:hypothetical protein
MSIVQFHAGTYEEIFNRGLPPFMAQFTLIQTDFVLVVFVGCELSVTFFIILAVQSSTIRFPAVQRQKRIHIL